MIKTLLIFTAILASVINIFSQDEGDLSALKNEELIAGLLSKDSTEVTESGKEIFKRGEKMLPLLMKLKNNKSITEASVWFNPHIPHGIRAPVEDATPEDIEEGIKQGYYVTTEATALYLISAIYYNNLNFAQVAYLKGNRYVKRSRHNTPERIAKAWKSTEKWYRELNKKGLEKLRKEKSSPLKSTKAHFYGTIPSQF